MGVYRKGLKNATATERAWLLYAAHLARNYAAQDVYEALAADPRTTERELQRDYVRSDRLEWFRKHGGMFIRVNVTLSGGLGRKVYRWRVPVRAALPPTLSPRTVTKTLTDREHAAKVRWRAGESGRPGALERPVICDAGGGTVAQPQSLIHYERRLFSGE